jgi:hypothetical protein
MLRDRDDAWKLLRKLGATERLLRHLQLVGEAADILIEECTALGVRFDPTLVELGAAVHDAGKILFPQELDGPGSRHEPAGKALLLENSVQSEVAHCCVSHAAWQDPSASFEERLIALADKLWKGKREEALELLVIDEVALRIGVDRWDAFGRLDTKFEEIAAGGTERLQRSRSV